MFIGEAPGATEDAKGIPFIGAAGQLLQKVLSNIGLTNSIYVTNIMKHRPPNNRKPSMQEMMTCGEQFLLEEIKTLQPKVIVCLGRSPAEYLLNLNGKTHKGTLRGHTFPFYTSRVFCTWHPSYILRRNDKLTELEEDLHTIMSYINQ